MEDVLFDLNTIVTNSQVQVSIHATVCDSYTSPSGNYVWTSSGTYNDTLFGASSAGCDSIITTHLTVTHTNSTLHATVCDSYTSPSGNYVWTSSGTYNDTLFGASSAGCDSIITTHLTITHINSTLHATVCDSYTSPSGNYIWTSSGTYNDTLFGVSSAGCDSIITTHLTITHINSTLHAMVCDSYTSPSGNYIWTSSGTYNDTLFGASSAGCDSVITINLTVARINSMISETATDKYIAPSGNYVWTSSGIYNDTLFGASSRGCDSVITINLTIKLDSYIYFPTAFTPK